MDIDPDKILILPIVVDALFVDRKDKGSWAGPSIRIDKYDQSAPYADKIASVPFEKARPLRPGVHLHFKLPRWFLTDQNDGKGEPKFPPTPDRWLVQRWTNTFPLEPKAWLVASDSNGKDGNFWSQLIQYQNGERMYRIQHVGKAVPLSGDAPEPELNRIAIPTAIGPGLPGFSGYYPDSGAVFGFHDDLDGLPEDAVVNYSVLGWYSKSKNDPVAQSGEKLDEFLNTAGWKPGFSIRERLDSSQVHTLALHGSVVSVDPDRVRPLSQSERHEVSVGPTAAEAMSALMLGQERSQVDETLLTALQEDLWGLPDDPRDLPGMIHARRFHSRERGPEWKVVPKAQQQVDAEQAQPSLPAKVRALLDRLNKYQRQINQGRRELLQDRQMLYALWRRQKEEDAPEGIDQAIETLVERIEKRVDHDLWGLEGIIGAARHDVDNALKAFEDPQDPTQGYELCTGPGPAFYEANEPVVSLKGSATHKHVVPSIVGANILRLPSELRDAFDIHWVVAGFRKTGRFSAEPFWVDWQETEKIAKRSHPLAARLLAESVFSNPVSFDAMVKFYQSHLGLRSGLYTPGDQIARHLRSVLGVAMDVQSFSHPISKQPGQYFWVGNPWRPYKMEWRGTWYARKPVSDADETVGQIGQDWDLHITDPDRPLKPGRDVCGHGPVTTISENLLKQISKQNVGNELQAYIQGSPIATQRLAGFNAAIMGRMPVPTIPPLMAHENQKVDKIADVLGVNGIALSELPIDPANPDADVVRCGDLKLTEISIIDTFGRRRKVFDASHDQQKQLLRAKAYGNGDALRLRPRLATASRLNTSFNWRDTEKERPAIVAGWILRNALDHCYAIYSSDGALLGRLERNLDRLEPHGFHWRAHPEHGGAYVHDRNLSEAEVPDPLLRRFCNWLLSGDREFADSFSHVVVSSLHPEFSGGGTDSFAPALATGHPLALVNVSVSLSSEAYAPHVPGVLDPAAAQTDEGLNYNGSKDLRWPLRIGDRQLRDNGVAGVFAPGSGSDAARFIRPWDPLEDDADVGAFSNQDFTIALDETQEFTILMDPYLPVHLTTGALPRQKIELPPDQREGLKRIRQLFFQTGPVLGDGTTDARRMPRPSDDFGRWSWHEQGEALPLLGELDGVLPGERASIYEGWLQLDAAPVILSFSTQNGARRVARDSEIILTWELDGADRYSLSSQTTGEDPVVVDEWDATSDQTSRPVTISEATVFTLTAQRGDRTDRLTLEIALDAG